MRDMLPRRSSRAGLGIAVALLGGGCGSSSGPLPPACLTVPTAVERALRAAPGPVTLSDGTRLSDCVARASADSDLQAVGGAFSGAADDLAGAIARSAPDTARDRTNALRLGYLVGATRRGARHSQGIAAELVRRVEQSAGSVATTPAVAAAVHAGLVAGQTSG